MKVENSQAIFSLPRRMVRILLVAMLTLTSLGIPFATNAIAAPQPNLAAVKTQNRMIDKQNRALDSQNNPDGIEFGFEDEARILGVEDTLDKVKEAFGGEEDQRSRNSKESFTKTSRSTIQAKKKAKQDINKVENASEDIGENIKDTANLAKNRASRDIDRVQNATEDLTSSVRAAGEDLADSIKSDSSNQSLAKKDKTVGLDKTKKR